MTREEFEEARKNAHALEQMDAHAFKNVKQAELCKAVAKALLVLCIELTPRDPGKCPGCGSAELGGQMAAFWVPLDKDGVPTGEWIDWERETELGPKRCCYECGFEW